MMVLNDIYNAAMQECTKASTLVADTNEFYNNHVVSNGTIYSSDLHACTLDGAFLTLFMALENFLESSFVCYMMGQPGLNGNSFAKYVSPVSEENARNILKGINTRKPLARGLLIAAIIASLLCLTAFAIKISLSLREAARIDMGISAETPIPEWTEYNDVEKAEEEPKDVQVTLMSTMCAEERLYAYIAISPVPEQIAAILAENSSPEYEWDLSGMSTAGCTFHTEQTSYDPETQTALVKVFVRGEELKQMEQVELTLELTHNLKPEESYGPIVIPVTQSQMISIPVDIPVENTKAHFNSAWGMPPEMMPDML